MGDTTKDPVSDEERIALASKLDKELDEFIAGLERKAYTDGWKEDQWQEEMEKHPFFMKNVPENGAVSPLVEGLQQLKYSPDENSPKELAEAYKEDGNFNFKCKNYRMAIISYSEGLKQDIDDANLKAQLYNNRAASHFLLKNFRSCYNDCKLALKFLPDYDKAKKRLAETCNHLGAHDECIEICDSLLLKTNDKGISNLRMEAMKQKKSKERDKRKEQIKQKKESSKKDKLREMVEERGIKFYPKAFWEMPDALPQQVHIEDEKLVWPVVLLYPEYKISDLIQNFHEDNTFQEQLEEVFKESPEWDVHKKYSMASLVIHYEDVNGRLHSVKKIKTLKSVLTEPDFRVDGCTPAFLVHAKGTPAYETFLNLYQ